MLAVEGSATRLTHAHVQQELDVAPGLLEFAEQQFHRLDRRHARERAAEQDDAVVFVGMVEQFLFARAGALDVDRGENAAVHQRAVKMDFHVAGAFELFKDDFVHARSGVHERGRDDGKRAAFLDVARRAEETFRLVQRIGGGAAGKNLAGVRLPGEAGLTVF